MASEIAQKQEHVGSIEELQTELNDLAAQYKRWILSQEMQDAFDRFTEARDAFIQRHDSLIDLALESGNDEELTLASHKLPRRTRSNRPPASRSPATCSRSRRLPRRPRKASPKSQTRRTSSTTWPAIWRSCSISSPPMTTQLPNTNPLQPKVTKTDGASHEITLTPNASAPAFSLPSGALQDTRLRATEGQILGPRYDRCVSPV